MTIIIAGYEAACGCGWKCIAVNRVEVLKLARKHRKGEHKYDVTIQSDAGWVIDPARRVKA